MNFEDFEARAWVITKCLIAVAAAWFVMVLAYNLFWTAMRNWWL